MQYVYLERKVVINQKRQNYPQNKEENRAPLSENLDRGIKNVFKDIANLAKFQNFINL